MLSLDQVAPQIEYVLDCGIGSEESSSLGHRLEPVHGEQWKRARVARICQARALLAEFGISVPWGVRGLGKKLRLGTEQAPILIQPTLLDLIQEIDDLEQRLKRVDHTLTAYAQTNPEAQVLLGIQGIGVVVATAFVARVPSIHMFKRGRSFSSWLGLTCREYSSGQTRRLSRITKQGDRYLRTMLIHGARAALLAVRILSWPGGTPTTYKGRIHECSRFRQTEITMCQPGEKK